MNIVYTPEEQSLINRLDTPEKVQRFIDKNITYDGGDTIKSFRRVLKSNRAHCLEGALFTAAILSQHKYPPLILCCEARDMDHMLFVYRKGGMWGTVGQALHKELKGRDPVYLTLRDLVLSYLPYYWNGESKKPDRETDLTLRGYTIVDLAVFEENWITAKEELHVINSYLYEIPHRWLFPKDKDSVFYRCDDKGVITEL
jgi:hypothetical protein